MKIASKRSSVPELNGVPGAGPAKIDRRIRSVVDALNALPGVTTTLSCGGHRHPKDEDYQLPLSRFYVTFIIERTAEGWQTLDSITHVCDPLGQDVAIFVQWDCGLGRGAEFSLHGDGLHPNIVAQRLRQWTKATPEQRIHLSDLWTQERLRSEMVADR